MVLSEAEPFIVGPKPVDTTITEVKTQVTESIDAPLREKIAAGVPVGPYGASVARVDGGPPRVIFMG